MTTPTFTIEGLSFDYSANVLEVHVDSHAYDRAYIASWSPDSFAVRKHWTSECIDSTDELHKFEAWELRRFLDSSDDVAEAFARLSVEPAPVHGNRRSA